MKLSDNTKITKSKFSLHIHFKDTLKMAASDSEIIGAAIFKIFVGSLFIPKALVAASLLACVQAV